MASGNTKPLAGVRVIELGNFIAAPTAGRILAEFGAEVIKIERPKTGDDTRNWRAHGLETSLFFRYMSRNKKSVTIDLRMPSGQQIVRKLADTADVILENFRPGTLERWHLGPDVLREHNKGLIVIRISGYGQDGPYSHRAGFGGVAEAMGGIRHMTGYPGKPPVRVGISLGDQLAALYAVIGALLGLRERQNDSAGESVDVALYEAVFSIMESTVPDYDAFKTIPGPVGTDISSSAPSGTYPCEDGAYAVIGGNGDAIFPRLMDAIGRSDLGSDPQLKTNEGRVQRRFELNDAIAKWTGLHKVDDVVRILDECHVPCGKIYTVADIMTDPQYSARSMFVRSPVDLDGERTNIAFPGIVPKLARHPGSVEHLVERFRGSTPIMPPT